MNDDTLKQRLQRHRTATVAAAACTVGLLWIALLWLYQDATDRLQQLALRHGELLATHLAADAAPQQIANDRLAMQRLLNAVVVHEPILGARIDSLDGTPLAQAGETRAPHALRVTAPIRLQDTLVGEISLYARPANRHLPWSPLLVSLVGGGGLLLLLGVLLGPWPRTASAEPTPMAARTGLRPPGPYPGRSAVCLQVSNYSSLAGSMSAARLERHLEGILALAESHCDTTVPLLTAGPGCFALLPPSPDDALALARAINHDLMTVNERRKAEGAMAFRVRVGLTPLDGDTDTPAGLIRLQRNLERVMELAGLADEGDIVLSREAGEHRMAENATGLLALEGPDGQIQGYRWVPDAD